MVENHKVLVVDDDARLRALLERYLSEQVFKSAAWLTASRWIVC